MSFKSESANRSSNCDKTFNLRIKLGNNFRDNECVSGKGLSEDSASETESEENKTNNINIPLGQRRTHRTFQNKSSKSATEVDVDALLISREKSLIKDLNYCRVCKYKLSGRKHDNHFQTHRHKILEHFYDLCMDKGMDWGDMNARSFTCALHPDRFISSVEIMVKHCNRQHPDIVKSLNLPISNIWKTRLENQLGKDVVETELASYTEENTNVKVEEPEKLNLKLKPTNSPHQIFACSKCSYRNFQRISVLKHIIQKHNLTAGMAGKFIIKTSKIIKSIPNKNTGPKKQPEARTLSTEELEKYRVKGNMSVKCMQVMDATLQHYSQFQPRNLQYVSNRLKEEFIRFAKNQKKHNENGFYYCPTCKHKYPTVKSGKQHILRIAHSKNFFSEEYRTRYKIMEAYANYNENNEFIGMVGGDSSNKSRASKERSVSSVEDFVDGDRRKNNRDKIIKPKAIKRMLPSNSTPVPNKVVTKDWDRINTPDSLNLVVLPPERKWMEAINDISALALADIGQVPNEDRNRLFRCLDYIHSLSVKYSSKPQQSGLLNLLQPSTTNYPSMQTVFPSYESDTFKRPGSPSRLKITDRGLRRIHRSPSGNSSPLMEDETNLTSNGLLNNFDSTFDLEEELLRIENSPSARLVAGSNGAPVAQKIKTEGDW